MSLLTVFLKLIYLIPFLNNYIISRREKKLHFLNDSKLIIVGFILVLINVITIIFISLLGFFKVLNEPSVIDVYVYQLISNLFLFFGYLLLMIQSFKFFYKQLSLNSLLILCSSIIFISIPLISLSANLLIKINILIYVLSIYFLINSFIIIGSLLRKYDISYYYFVFIGSFLLIIDPVLFIKVFLKLSDFVTLNYFKTISFVVSSIGMFFILIPSVTFLLKVSKNKELMINKSDLIVEKVIKALFNETQKIYGEVTVNIFRKVFEEYNLFFNESFTLKGLSVSKQKSLLKDLLSNYLVVFSEELTINLIKRVINKRNKSLILSQVPVEWSLNL